MIASWFRTGGSNVPRDKESLSVDDDGTFHLWRAVGATAAGRFSGVIDPSALVQAAALVTDDLAEPQRPGTGVETVTIGERRADIGTGTLLDGPWAAVFDRMRELSDELIDQPSAAIALQVGESTCTLVHIGTDEVQVALGSMTLRADAWEGWYVPAGSWIAPSFEGAETVIARPGWSVALPFDHGLMLGEDRTLHVAVDVSIVVAGNPIAAGLRYAPVPPRP
ncbi:MAG TPA: hypothetical protein VGJ28_23915 [Micromonosporaceae bacterium]|jgi:hypothetical protein